MQRLRVGVFPLVGIEESEVVETNGGVGMVSPELLFSDRQSTDIQGFGVGIFPLVVIEGSEIVEAGGGGGMISA
jgi:hypothetical protein